MTQTLLTPGSTGCKPRFCTPRDESFPTHGPVVGEIAERLGRPLMPWQQDLADVAYEYDADTGRFRYNEVDATVPRQSGKTTITLAKKVFRLVVLPKTLGPQRSLYVAQTRVKARLKLERDFAELLRGSDAFREVANYKARPKTPTEWRLSLNNGTEHLQLGASNYLQIDAPSRTGGHGDTLDDGTIDEAFAHDSDEVEAGMRPTMATRKNAQLWVISTAGDARSKYLYRKVLAGRAASESGEHGGVCYVEYSAPDDADPGDPAVWAACMPALGHTIDLEFIRGEWERHQRGGVEGINGFRRAYLNQWPDVPILGDTGAGGAFPEPSWKALADPDAPRGTDVSFGLATAPDRSWTAIAVAWRRDDGAAHVVLADYRPTTAWVQERAEGLISSWGGQIRATEACRGLFDGAVVLTRQEQTDAQIAMRDQVNVEGLRHGNQAALNTAVRSGQWRTSGDTQVLDTRGDVDISPLVAAALALSGLDDGEVQFW